MKEKLNPDSRGGKPQQTVLIRQARSIMVLIGVIVGLMQIVQHINYGGIQFNLFLIAEVAFYVIILPLLGSVILKMIQHSEQARQQTRETLTQQQVLMRSLSSTAEWNELLSRVAEFPHFFIPVSTSALYLRQNDNCFSLVGFWGQGSRNPGHIPTTLVEAEMPTCAAEPRLFQVQNTPAERQHWSLPLCLGSQVLGCLSMTLFAGQTITPAQQEMLERSATDLALLLDRGILRKSAISQALANQAERHEIARDLHDTLAQNIAYLRLKLEELLLEENPSSQIGLIRKELGRMRDTADEAYSQVREALANLHRDEIPDLSQALLERAMAVGERAGFAVELRQRGIPRSLTPEQARQITYICREALNNIEKYSRSTQVYIEMAWGDAELEMNISDNGAGFDPAQVNRRDHYGLTIMQERSAAVGGEFNILSAVGGGTTVTLRIPYDAPVEKPAVLLNMDKVGNETANHR